MFTSFLGSGFEGMGGAGAGMSDPFGRLRGMRKLFMPHIQITHEAKRLYSKGPKALTMRALGAALGVQASALYRHFKNKDAIIEAVAAVAEFELAFRIRPSARLQPPKDRASFMAERALLFLKEQPHLFRLATRRLGSGFGGHAGSAGELLREQFGKAMNEGQLRKSDIRGVCEAFWAQICGLVSMHERGDLPAQPVLQKEAWMASTHRMLRGLRAA